MRFNDKTVCIVTGGLGFIGSNFIMHALSLGWKIINIDKITYASQDPKNLNFTTNVNYYHIKEDISKIKTLPYCELIVNFAAESHVDNSIDGPLPFVKSNVMGVYNLLEILRKTKVINERNSWSYHCPLFVQISTDEIFGDIKEGFFKENDRAKPSNPYASTKAAAELLLFAWNRTYDIPFLLTRTTNNYGPHQHPEKLIPMAITKASNNEKIIVHGNGQYIRNWIHVQDNVEAIMFVVQNGELNNTYHIASDEEYSVIEIVKKILKIFNKPYDYDTIDSSQNRSGVDVRYALNTDKIKSLGWLPQRRLDIELEKIIQREFEA